MPYRLLTLLSMLGVAATALVIIAGARGQPQHDFWSAQADEALRRFGQVERDESAHAYAYAAYAAALLRGWDEPLVARYLQRVYSLENPDGGYGLSEPYDAFQDGSVNPAETTYVVSITDHVGRVLLEGWRAGSVPRERVQRLVDLTSSAPLVADEGPGICVAYSLAPEDSVGCVHNVNAGAGWFLTAAAGAGFENPAISERIALITQRETFTYLPNAGSWPYSDRQAKLNSFNHNAYSIESMRTLAPPIAAHAGRIFMDNGEYGSWVDVLGHVRLLPYHCEYAPRVARAFSGFVDHPEQNARILAQAAVWSARVAATCR